MKQFSSSIFCQICGKGNHIAPKCWYQYDFSHIEDEVPQALVAININEVSDPNWYADTGATAYMTNYPGNLISCPSFKGNEKILLGNSAGLSISHGESTVLHSSPQDIKLWNVLVVPTIKKKLIIW